MCSFGWYRAGCCRRCNNELRPQAMAYQMSADDRGKHDVGPLQCSAHDPGNDAASLNRADRRKML
jgi:hypothetical protein